MPGNYSSGAKKRKMMKTQNEQNKKMAGIMNSFFTPVSLQETNMNEGRDEDDTGSTSIITEVFSMDDEDLSVSSSPKNMPTNESDNDDLGSSSIGKEVFSIDRDLNAASSSNNVQTYDNDPAKWTLITHNMIEYFITHPPPQNIEKVSETEKLISGTKRSLTKNHFYLEAKDILPSVSLYTSARIKKIPRNRMLDDRNTDPVIFEPRKHFIVNCHYALCDALLTNLKKRKVPYDSILKKFSCLTMTDCESIHIAAKSLQEHYASDFGEEFVDELLQFSTLIKMIRCLIC